MSQMQAHRILHEDAGDPDIKEGASLAIVHPASAESVEYVMGQSPDDPDGRSQFMWVRLRNGDLILGVYPQGETYFAVEIDASSPSEV